GAVLPRPCIIIQAPPPTSASTATAATARQPLLPAPLPALVPALTARAGSAATVRAVGATAAAAGRAAVTGTDDDTSATGMAPTVSVRSPSASGASNSASCCALWARLSGRAARASIVTASNAADSSGRTELGGSAATVNLASTASPLPVANGARPV